MPTNYRKPKHLSNKQQTQLLQNCKSKKYRLIILLMLDCGLRVTEVVRLQLKDFNFMNNHLLVNSLKKRGQDVQRKIPMTQRLLDALAIYYQSLKDHTSDTYLFSPGKGSKQAHLSRKQVWRYINKISGGTVYPHMLHHSFATRIVNNGNELRIAKELLGHQSIATTEIYTHVVDQQMQLAIQSIEKDSWVEKLYRKLVPRKQISIIPTDKGIAKFHVGRKLEMARLVDLEQKRMAEKRSTFNLNISSLTIII